MYTIIFKVASVALALLLATKIIPGISIDSLSTALIAAVVLGFLNAVVRPVLIFLTLPITILTLGLFIVVINTSMFALAASIMPGFTVNNVWSALLGSILVSAVSMVSNRLKQS